MWQSKRGSHRAGHVTAGLGPAPGLADPGRLMLRLRGPLFLLRLVPTVFDLRGSGDATPPTAYYLGILSVRADWRGRGIGGLLLADVCRRAKAAECDAVYLHAELDNAGALASMRGTGSS